ncbi:hypothetical protein HH213_17265 [Duganella dendranthematis]|uniref:Uncharacterized protein n=1 Tax=Duganella dendranthematis TaxID=2728021 RepID=A0ABX6MFI6_9BURK|nr:hypothetical protein [Duganella dendranthematis]QJD91682.1 hypothetical protein HH213_17265 [Duganella dendranthematis]
MLHAEIKYRVDDANGQFGLTINRADTGLSATLHGPYFPEVREIAGYMPWQESGFAMLSRGLAEFAQELGYEAGMFTEAEIRFTFADTGAVAANAEPLCVANFVCSATANRLVVDGPVLRMTAPIRGLDIPEDLFALLQFLLKICDSRIGNSGSAATEVLTYSATAGGPDFIFVDDIPTSIQPWFLASAKAKAHILQRGGLLASAKAYADFCSGRP